MSPDENRARDDAATLSQAVSAPAPVPASSAVAAPTQAATPAFSNREVRIGGVALGLGVVAGIVASLLVASVAGSIGSIMSTSPMADATAACKIEADTWITVGDKGQSITMDGKGEESAGADYTDVLCILNELGTPDSVISRIDTTRALDGRQTGTWDKYSASWGYHPDNGLDIVVEVSK